MDDEAIKLSPASQMLSMDSREAACPLEVHIAATPPSKAAIFFSTASVVGFSNREYIRLLVGSSKTAATSSVES